MVFKDHYLISGTLTLAPIQHTLIVSPALFAEKISPFEGALVCSLPISEAVFFNWHQLYRLYDF